MPTLTCGSNVNCPGGQPDNLTCVCVGCNTNGACQTNDDCVCPDCTNVCGNDCNNSGICDPYYEGCGCPDCFGHPLCP